MTKTLVKTLQTHWKICDLFDEVDIIVAWELYRSCADKPAVAVNRLCDEFVRSRIDAISEITGVNCDAKYVAYVLLAVFQEARVKVS